MLGLYCKRTIGQVKTNEIKQLKDREKSRKYQAKVKEITANQKHQQNFRTNRKKKKIDALEAEKGAKIIKNNLKTEKEELVPVICRIAISGSAAYKIRRSDIKWTVKTLDQLLLTSALNRERCELKSSVVYLNLLPKNSSREGQRHLTTSPVKCVSAKNSKHSSHPSTKFTKESINALKELVCILGPVHVIFLSQVNEAKVPMTLLQLKTNCHHF